jgi:hypothetical protein
LIFNLIGGSNLIAGFKAEIRAGLMKKEGQLMAIYKRRGNANRFHLISKEDKIYSGYKCYQWKWKMGNPS